MSNQAKRLSECPAERLASCRGEASKCMTCKGTGIEYDGAGHTCTACNGAGRDVNTQNAEACQKCSPAPKMEFDRLAHAQVLAICRGAAASCIEQHSHMQGAKTDAKSWFPHKWVIDAIRDLIGINQSTCSDLRADAARVKAEVSALQQRLNIADQRVDDLQSEVTKARDMVRWFYTHANVHQVGTAMMDAARDFIAHQPAPAAKLDASIIGIVHTPPMEYDEP